MDKRSKKGWLVAATATALPVGATLVFVLGGDAAPSVAAARGSKTSSEERRRESPTRPAHAAVARESIVPGVADPRPVLGCELAGAEALTPTRALGPLLAELHSALESGAEERAARIQQELSELVARDGAAAARAVLETVLRANDPADVEDSLALLADEPELAARPEVAEGLLGIASSADLASTRAAALRLLGDLPGESGERSQRLAAIGRGDGDPSVREAAAGALAAIAERAPGDTASSAAKSIVASLAHEPDASVRATLLGSIRDTRDPAVADALLTALSHEPDDDARAAAAEALGDVALAHRARVVSALASRFGAETGEELRRTLLASIVRAGRSSATATLESLLPVAGTLASDVNDYLAVLRSGEDDPVKLTALKEARESARGAASPRAGDD